MIRKLLFELTRHLGIECLIKSARILGIQVILDESNILNIPIAREFGQFFHERGIFLLRPLGVHPGKPKARQGFDCHKHTTGPLAFVMIIICVTFARLHRDWHQAVASQLARPFIETDDGPTGIIRQLVQVKQIFHQHQEQAGDLTDAPLAFLPGLEVVFLSKLTTVAGEIESTNFSSTNLSARSLTVHR